MNRLIRNITALFFGLFIGGFFTFLVGNAEAAQWSGVATANVKNSVTNTSQKISAITGPAFTNGGAGTVLSTSEIQAIYGASSGASVPVSVAMAAKQTITPANIAAAVIGTGGNLPASIVALALPVLVQSGMNYANGQWGHAAVAGDDQRLTMPAPGVISGIVNGFDYNGKFYTTPATACNAFIADYRKTYPNATCIAPFVSPQGYWQSYIANGVFDGYLAGGYPAQSCGGAGAPITVSQCTTYSCPAGKNWTLEGTTCTRLACVNDEIRDSSGVCVAPFVNYTVAQAQQALTAAITAYPDPAALVMAWPSNIDPDPNNQTARPVIIPTPLVTSAPVVSTIITPATQTSPATTTSKATTTSVSSTVDPSTGEVIATVTNKTVTTTDGVVTSTTTDPAVPKEDPVPAVTDTPLDEIPKLYERKYPDGFMGAWNTRSAEIRSTPLFGLSSLFAPNIAAGTCPTWTFNANIGPHMQFGTGSISPPCWLWTALKAVLIITALMISRRLVFGG